MIVDAIGSKECQMSGGVNGGAEVRHGDNINPIAGLEVV
jgi:hypothetical protein